MTDQTLEAFQNLQDELKRLSQQTLPVQTRAAIQQARQRISQLVQSLPDEQGSDRLTALYRVSQSLGLSLNLDEVLTQVMDAVIQLTGAERGFLTLIDLDTNAYDLRAARNFEQETLHREDMNISRTVVQSVIESGNGVVTTDAQKDPRFSDQQSVVINALRSIMCAPLRARSNIIGVIYVDNRAHTGLFTKEDLDLLNTFASQAAVAIENARLYTRTDQALTERVEELETLSKIDMQLNEKLDLARVIELTRDRAVKGTGAISGWIALPDEDSNSLRLASHSRKTELPPPDETIFSRISDDLTPRTVLATKNKPVYLVAPLLLAKEVLGAVVVAHPKKFTDNAAQFLERLAARSASTLENARLYQAVQQANESKSQFVSIVTHELRIPLTSIKGYTDLIRQGAVGPVNDQQMNFLGVIRNNVERMATLISDLSDVSRIERGKLKLDSISIPIDGYVDETLKSLLHHIDEKSQTIKAEIPTELPRVFADPNRVVQVLTNLISNAWKYTPEGGQITVKAHADDESVYVEVIDTGIGISAEDQAKLFSQFFRSESPAVREQTGWGLGLNVTKRLVETMSGKIGMHSLINEGSTFWFSLPITEPDTTDDH
jgi:signal transduction histidine kinase